MEGRKK